MEAGTQERGHFLLKAATTVGTEQGTFTAVISTGDVDLDRDVIEPDAMVTALKKWATYGKLVPLDWNHGKGASDQVGHVDPQTVKAVDGEVVIDGWVDQSTENGAEVWRLVKGGTLGFSFHGAIPHSGVTKRKGGGLHVHELDVLAVTACTGPSNPHTRVLTWKAPPPDMLVEEIPDFVLSGLDRLSKELDDEAKVDLLLKAQDVLGVQYPRQTEVTDKEPEVRSVDPLRKRSEELALEIVSDGMSLRKTPPTTKPEPPPELVDLRELKRRSRDLMLWQLSGMETDV
jgi:hypothetical protein